MHTVKRLGEVGYDTGKINLMAESAPIVGPAISGQMANSCAENYKKIVSDLDFDIKEDWDYFVEVK